jgi:GNAT superfamily N-acetyltransferase
MLQIRPATPTDAPQILTFIRELAEYEKEPLAAQATEAEILRDGFPADPAAPRRFHCLMAEWQGQPAGFALYFYNYSTWRGHAGIYLEDLFVRPHLRGHGIDWNTPAIDFYRAMGALPMSEWTTMRVTGEALGALAALASPLKQ